ncbi:hypothetical protein Dfri01_67100 [Dyadobacter frigoris]|uniref:hypothetical protein n=1 Tax=Dyadobacter frigoris TaxID=2576211 RepID=UPI0024A22560|nr:hypothetical protein [Dyadobacter frigoris]GLU57249.1 hypothetical protein Dfri01_67100 [Dyadobacter frigoris]
MTTTEITKVVLGILAALGGGGAIVLGLSNYFGQFLAKRYEEKIKVKFQNEINEYQSQLDIIKKTTIRYSDKQFEHYSKLWASLYELKILADDLWQQANPARLEKFSKQLRLTKNEIEKASLFVEETHYKELTDTIKHFSEYQIGKSDLITYRQADFYDNYQVQQMIANNGVKKSEFEKLILVVKADLKKQIRGK